MDIRLGGARDGIDAAAEILERFGIPSVLVTAQADPATRRRGQQTARPIGWVFKPFSPGELAAAVGEAVAHARQHGPKK
jgi:two-component system, response regulator PdtaR